MAEAFGFECSCCGEWHDGLPDLAFNGPYYYEQLSDEEKANAKKSDDVCVIGEDFFVRGIVLVPIVGYDAHFALGSWVSLSETNFRRYLELFDAEDPSAEPPYFGWFSNQVPGFRQLSR